MGSKTIAAIATALGEAGIGIVRLSGAEAIEIVDKMFVSAKGSSLRDTANYTMRYGTITDVTGKTIDEVLVSVMRGPRSFTGEDVVEVNCHGGIVVLQKVLERALQSGAEMAEPGEFTKRAFLNGRLDLSQAEAVIDVIRSRTEVGLGVAIDQLEGSLSKRIKGLREDLYGIIVRVEASIDFPEDDIPDVEYSEMSAIIENALSEIRRLISTADDGKMIREGLKVVITGKPNVGKSSLLNRLLDENRALVTEIPGTTRDVIEEVVNLQGLPVRILDTAGIRESEDVVEQMGVQRAKDLWKEADLILHVLDRSQPLSREDAFILEQNSDKKRLIVINKTDLPAKWSTTDLKLEGEAVISEVSLIHDSLEQLIETILEFVGAGKLRASTERAIVTRTRHKSALIQAEDDLLQAKETLELALPVDLISVGLQGALEHLGEITGETVRDSVIDRIFAQFCIGK